MKKLTPGQRIRARRKELRFTQKALAKALRLSDVSVSQWERDDSDPTGKNLFLLCRVLKCAPAWVLFGDEDKKPEEPKEEERSLLNEQQQELLDLFDALPESEQEEQLQTMRARVKNNEKLFEELLEARKRISKK